MTANFVTTKLDYEMAQAIDILLSLRLHPLQTDMKIRLKVKFYSRIYVQFSYQSLVKICQSKDIRANTRGKCKWCSHIFYCECT
jgi:hypothetical protein